MNSGPVRNGGRDAEARYSIFHFLSHCKAKEPHSAQAGSQFLIPIRDFPPSLPKNFSPLSDEKKEPWREISTFAQNRRWRRFPILKWREILREYGAHPAFTFGKVQMYVESIIITTTQGWNFEAPVPSPCSSLHTRVIFPPVEWELLHYAILPPHPPVWYSHPLSGQEPPAAVGGKKTRT